MIINIATFVETAFKIFQNRREMATMKKKENCGATSKEKERYVILKDDFNFL